MSLQGINPKKVMSIKFSRFLGDQFKKKTIQFPRLTDGKIFLKPNRELFPRRDKTYKQCRFLFPRDK